MNRSVVCFPWEYLTETTVHLILPESAGGSTMIALDHMSVPCRDKVETAEFYARVFGLTYNGPRRDFAPLTVNDGLTLNFENGPLLEDHHYAFRVAAEEFEAIQERLRVEGVGFGTAPRVVDGAFYDRGGLRGFYFEDPNGHGLEVITPA